MRATDESRDHVQGTICQTFGAILVSASRIRVHAQVGLKWVELDS
jgi:hypothetical protein